MQSYYQPPNYRGNPQPVINQPLTADTEMKGKLPVTILTISLLILTVLSRLNMFLSSSTGQISFSLDYWTEGFMSGLDDPGFAFYYYISIFRNNILGLAAIILFALFVLRFYKKPSGIILPVVSYSLLAIKCFWNFTSNLQTAANNIRDALTHDHISDYAVQNSLDIYLSFLSFLACAAIVLVFCLGLPKKGLLIPAASVLILYNIYNSVTLITFWSSYEMPAFITVINICTLIAPILMHVITLIYGLQNTTPSIKTAFSHASAEKTQGKINKAVKLYEADLEDLNIRYQSGNISEQYYNELKADIIANINAAENGQTQDY